MNVHAIRQSLSHIIVVTGASGAGKTAAVQALESRGIPGVRCFQFDSIGVPTPEIMQREYGGGEHWQAAATAEWLERLGALPAAIRVAVLDGQTRPSFVFAAKERAADRMVHVTLLDCSRAVRDARLHSEREQPELASDRMDNWAAYLRGQADALGLPVIDTTDASIDEVADVLEATLRPYLSSDAASG
jgi:hypothetical protein